MARARTRVLLVEDDPADVLLVQRRMADPELWGTFSIRTAAGLAEAQDCLGKEAFDVVLLDLHLPDSRGLETVRRLREMDGRIPLVCFTTAGDRETALGALDMGAQDYLVKDELMTGAAIERVICYAIERCRMTERNESLEARVREQEKVESLRWLAAGVAVGFNTALGEILDRVDQVGLDLASTPHAERARANLGAIRKEALRAAEMARQLRAYAATAPAPHGQIDLSGFVLQMSELLENMMPSNVALQFELGGDVPVVQADALQCRQLLVSLVLNATEAVGRRAGSVQVRTGSLWADADYLARAHCDGDLAEGAYAFLRVSDTGESIDPETEARMFDPFFSTRHGGRGLGLAAALGIARRHGGAIRVESGEAGGVVLSVLFPVGRQARRVLPHATRKRAES